MNILIWTLSIGITLFQFVDLWTTMKVLEHGGHEDNPFMQMLFKGLGVNIGLLIGKFYVVALVLAGAWFGWWESKIGFSLLILLFGLYGVVVNHNLNQYKKG